MINISGMVTVLGRPEREAKQLEKSPSLNWAAQLLTVAYNDAYSRMLLSEWRKFPLAYCLVRKKNLMAACFLMLLKSRASPYMLSFSLCNKKTLAIRHMNRLLFSTIILVPSYGSD
jgi:hypothetical protein